MKEVIVTCRGERNMARFTCTGNSMGCAGEMNDRKFDQHMRVCHPSADAYQVNVEARRNGQAMFVDHDNYEEEAVGF